MEKMSAEGPPGMRLTPNRDVKAKVASVVIVEVTEETAMKDFEEALGVRLGIPDEILIIPQICDFRIRVLE
jgi:hypothetical protein